MEFINTPEDCQWLRDVHAGGPGYRGARSGRLSGDDVKTRIYFFPTGVFLRIGADRVPLLHVAPRVAFTYSRGWAANALRMLRSIAKDN